MNFRNSTTNLSMVQIDEHSKFFGEVLEELALYKLSSSIAVSKWIADNAFIEDKLEVIASHNISNVSYESKINLELLQLIMKSINAIIIFTQNGIACNGSAALNILVGYLCKVNLPKNMNYPSLFHNLFRYVEKFINASETIPLSLATNLIKFIHYLFIIDQSQALQQFVYHQFRMSSIICVFRHPQRYFGTNKDFKSLHVHLLQILVFCLNKSHYAETFLLEVRRKVRKIVMDTGFFQFQLHNLLSILIMHHWKNDQNDLVNIIVEIFLPLYSHTFNFYLRKLREENFSLSCSKCTTPIINHLTEQTLFFNILLKIPKCSSLINTRFSPVLIKRYLHLFSGYLCEMGVCDPSNKYSKIFTRSLWTNTSVTLSYLISPITVKHDVVQF